MEHIIHHGMRCGIEEWQKYLKDLMNYAMAKIRKEKYDADEEYIKEKINVPKR